MHYTIKYAMSATTLGVVIDLSKTGNKFVATIWSMGEHRTIDRFESERFEEAEAVYMAWRNVHRANNEHEVEQTWDAKDFD